MARAAQASDKGDLWKQVASIQMEREKWKEALASLQKAQQKGGSKNPGEVQFLMGVTATQLRQWKTAETALRAAMQHEKWVKPATEWLGHLQEEQAYLEATSTAKDEKGEQDGKDEAPAAGAAKS
jgi:hypothetical protein